MATKLNLYAGDSLIKSVDKSEEGKTSVLIEELAPNTSYPKGTYKVSFSNDSGESSKVDVPEFKTLSIGVQAVELDVESLELTEGDTHQLEATVSPENATDKSVSFTSDNEEVATVSGDGLVTAVEEGTANVTVSTNDGGKTDVVVITVKEPVPEAPSNIDVTPSETSADIEV